MSSPAPPIPHALQPGQRILWYEIEGVLGQGGFGITYLARDTNLSRQVAIKEFFPSTFADRASDLHVSATVGQHADKYKWGLNSFLKEAQTLAQFKHSNIVQVHSVFEANNTAYMVMEYEDVNSLAIYIKTPSRRFDQAFFESILFPIMDGLRLVHDAGFIHRDIKPNNIIVRQNGSPVLIDFGSARQTDSQRASELTALISQGYTPPEQYSTSFGEQGPWTDIYALAASIYHGITGSKPADALARGTSQMAGQPDPLPALRDSGVDGYDVAFLSALDRGLAMRPTDRPQTLDGWRRLFPAPSITAADSTVNLDDDETLFGAIPDIIEPERKPSQDGGDSAATRIDPSPKSPDIGDGAKKTPPRKRSAALIAVPLLGVGIALAGAGWWFWQQPPPPSPVDPAPPQAPPTERPAPPDAGGSDVTLSAEQIRQLPQPAQAQRVNAPFQRLDARLQDLRALSELYRQARALDGASNEVSQGIDATLDDIDAFAALPPVKASGPLNQTLAALVADLAPGNTRTGRLQSALRANAERASPAALRQRLQQPAAEPGDDAALLYSLAALAPTQRAELSGSGRWDVLMAALTRAIAEQINAERFADAARLLGLALTLQPDDDTLLALQRHLEKR